jgi:aminoglycoside 6'-N-acetyltransferase
MPVVELRPISRDDFPLLGGWLQEPLIAEWWHDDPAPSALEARYGPSIDGTDRTRVLIACDQGEPVGLIQWYRLEDEPEYRAELEAAAVAVPADAVSLDYLIGPPDRRGRGFGRAMIAAALQEVRARGASAVLVPVHAGNIASQRVLERCGFRRVAIADLEPDNPAHDRRHVVLRLDLPGGDGPGATRAGAP